MFEQKIMKIQSLFAPFVSSVFFGHGANRFKAFEGMKNYDIFIFWIFNVNKFWKNFIQVYASISLLYVKNHYTIWYSIGDNDLDFIPRSSPRKLQNDKLLAAIIWLSKNLWRIKVWSLLPILLLLVCLQHLIFHNLNPIYLCWLIATRWGSQNLS